MAGEPVDQDAVERMLAAAAAVLRVHVPNADGCCAGCLACRGRLVMFERCTQVDWAEAVRAVYGGSAS